MMFISSNLDPYSAWMPLVVHFEEKGLCFADAANE